MRYVLILVCMCFFASASAFVVDNKNGIVRVDKFGKKTKSYTFKRDRAPNRNEIRPTWME